MFDIHFQKPILLRKSLKDPDYCLYPIPGSTRRD